MSADSTTPLEPLSGASHASSEKSADLARGSAGWQWPLVTVGAVLLIFAALQLWRPYFFLTDDNMSGVLPSFVDNGLQFKQGQLPPIIWQDPGAISIFFP